MLLWIACGALGLYAVYSIYKLSSTVYAWLGGDKYYIGVLIGQVLTLVMGFAWIAMFIISGEYNRKHAGEIRIFKLFGWILGIELVIILLGLILG